MADTLAAGNDPNTGNPTSTPMNSLPSNMAAFYLQQVTFWQGQVATLQATYTKLSSSTLSEYNLGSGDGRTMGKRHDIEALGRQIAFAMAQYRLYYQKLYGRNLMALRFRPR
jgi:hypothetical protein